MKNIHVLPTDKSSRLFVYDGELGLAKGFQYGSDAIQNQKIYITNDEEIKEGDYFYQNFDSIIHKCYKLTDNYVIAEKPSDYPKKICKKIILTTDQDLIKDGVQSIDDEFLEWFVKNPSCEEVQVGTEIWNDGRWNYFLPKKEPKVMKNIHILPTENSSRVSIKDGILILHRLQWRKGTHNIYITSNSKFVRDEYITDGIEVIKATPKLVDAQGLVDRRDWNKIIITTDQELIKDGVHSIGEEFLKWFVENPTCIKVEVVYGLFNPMGRQVDPNDLGQNHSKCVWKYKIITTKEEPKFESSIENTINIMSMANSMFGKKEEPKQVLGVDCEFSIDDEGMSIKIPIIKQETLEEAINNEINNIDINSSNLENIAKYNRISGTLLSELKKSMTNIAKWQQEQCEKDLDEHLDVAKDLWLQVLKQNKKLYSEEEVEDLIYKVCGTVARLQGITLNGNHIDTAYKQFKKK